MDLPSFIWLWRIAAWSMGLSLTVYVGLLVTGGGVWYGRSHQKSQLSWLRLVHIVLGVILLALVLVLLGIGIVGTRSEEHTSELQSLTNLVCRLLLEKKKKIEIGRASCRERV